MPWPSGGDYQQAVQNPRVVFRDPELKAGLPELDRLGMPKPRSGNFAVAFKMQCSGRDYAVRCFLGDSIDRRERYGLISDFLDHAKLPYTVTFKYQADGVLAAGAWRPMLKMEWVHGQTLGQYVSQNVTNAAKLTELAGRWVEMTQALTTAGMAHGDLQHGNVMVMPDGQIKLIDYDGMFVPALAGRPSSENGQPNYQHPLRGALDFGPNLDHFSEWVIYASLVALSLQPQLWKDLNGGDECLLFRKADFDPATSPALALLEKSKDERVRTLAEVFRSLLYFGVSQVPLIDASRVPARSAPAPDASATAAAPRGVDWLRDHTGAGVAPRIMQPTPTVAAATVPLPSPADASWVLSMLAPAPAPARFSNPTTLEWLVLVLSATIVVFFVDRLLPLSALALGVCSVANIALWLVRYQQQDIVRKAALSSRSVAQQRQKIAAVHARIQGLEHEKAVASRLLQQRLATIDAQRAKIKTSEDRAGDKPRAQLKLTLSGINEQRKRLADSDSAELRKLQSGLGSQLLAAQRELAKVDQAQIKDLADALEAARERHVQQRMEGAYVAQATIENIGPARLGYLRAAGVQTAADMKRRGLQNIPGIGAGLRDNLLNWANAVQYGAMQTRPMAVPADIERSVRARYETQRTAQTVRRDDLQRQMALEQQRMTAAHAQERQTLDQQEKAANTKANADLVATHASFAPKFKAADDEANTARQEHADRTKTLDTDINAAAQQMAGLKWQLTKVQHEHGVFKRITFGAYVRRAIWPFAA